jgi:hypothetical protein
MLSENLGWGMWLLLIWIFNKHIQYGKLRHWITRPSFALVALYWLPTSPVNSIHLTYVDNVQCVGHCGRCRDHKIMRIRFGEISWWYTHECDRAQVPGWPQSMAFLDLFRILKLYHWSWVPMEQWCVACPGLKRSGSPTTVSHFNVALG